MDILSMGVEQPEKRYLRVMDVKLKTIPASHTCGERDKIVLHTIEEGTSREFTISDAFVKDRDGSATPKGLWISTDTPSIPKNTTLGKLLEYYSAETLGDLKGLVVEAYPDHKNYLVILTYDK